TLRSAQPPANRTRPGGGFQMKTSVALTALLCIFASLVGAQSSGQIDGAVKDATGAVIPGAQIKATQTATGAVRTAVSGSDGSFTMPNLPLGPYLIEVTKDGFIKYVQSGLQLNVDSNPTIEVAMKIGNASEQITVEATTDTIETHSTNIGEV